MNRDRSTPITIALMGKPGIPLCSGSVSGSGEEDEGGSDIAPGMDDTLIASGRMYDSPGARITEFSGVTTRMSIVLLPSDLIKVFSGS